MDSRLDKRYAFDGNEYHGFTGSTFSWDEESGEWRIASRKKNVHATIKVEEFPLGKQPLNWRVF